VKKLLQVLTLVAILVGTLSAPTRVWADGFPWPHVVGSGVWAEGPAPWPHVVGSGVWADGFPWPHVVGSGVWAEGPAPWPHLTCLP
jgi:hypothetical protein